MSQRDDFITSRLANYNQASEGSNLPPRQYGEIRVPIVSNLKIIKVDNYLGGTAFTLNWIEPEFPNVQVAQYNIFVQGIDGNLQPQGPFGARRSPAVIRLQTSKVSNLVFIVQTQLTNGLTSPLPVSSSVAADTIAPVIRSADIGPSGVVAGIYGTATDVGSFTVNSQGILTDASNITIDLPLTTYRKGVLLGSLLAADFDSILDQPISIAATSYIIRRIIVTNASISLTTAAGGIYPAASKAGTPLVAATQIYTALTTATKYLDLTLEPIVGTDRYTLLTLYFSLTTAQGSPATGNIYIFGDIIS